MFSSILVGVDRSENSRAAVRHAADIASHRRASLTLIAVYNPQLPWSMTMAPGGVSQQTVDDVLDDARAEAQAALDEATALVPPDVDVHRVLASGEPAQAILDQASTGGHDLIVMGSRGRGD